MHRRVIVLIAVWYGMSLTCLAGDGRAEQPIPGAPVNVVLIRYHFDYESAQI